MPGRRSNKKVDPLAGLRRRSDITTRTHGLDLALYDPVTDKVHILDPIAAAFWQQATPDRTLEQIAEMVHSAFPKTALATITKDLSALLRKLRGLGLLVEVGARRPPKAKGVPEVTIPGTTITPITKGYVKPGVKTYTVVQLDRLVRKARELEMFCDTWLRPATDPRTRPG